MRGNTYSSLYGFTAFGESHGSAMGVVIEDIKPGVAFPIDAINEALLKRRPSSLPGSTTRKEDDNVQIISGVLDGITTGMPICLFVWNKDANSNTYKSLKDIFRPGHGDFSIFSKFKIYDWRGGGRVSGRETIARVIAGETLNHLFEGVEFITETLLIGTMTPKYRDSLFAKENPYFWPDPSTLKKIPEYLESVKTEGDSVGGVIQLTVRNLPAGWGDPVFEKLDANIAKAMLSVGGVKGIEIGDGFTLSAMKGSDSNDSMDSNGFETNHSGGIQAGISNGEDIIVRVAIKPVPSIAKPQNTIDIHNNEQTIEVNGRHDVCLIPRVIPVLISMLKLALADAGAYQQLIRNEKRDIESLRESLDKIDEDLLLLIIRRFNLVKEVIEYKNDSKIPITDKAREDSLIDSLREKATLLGLHPEIIEPIWQLIIAEGKKQK